MKLFVAASLSTLALAAPAAHANNEKRQFGGRTKNAGGGGGNCAPAFVFARGSTEPSPIVSHSVNHLSLMANNILISSTGSSHWTLPAKLPQEKYPRPQDIPSSI